VTPEVAQKRARLISTVRRFFETRGLLEVETPVLSAGAIADRHIDLLTVETRQGPRYLQSSPEQHMKRLLCDGYPDIFQLARVFRAGECGARHNPEFTMLEWYRHGYDMMQLIDEVAELCCAVLGNRTVRKLCYRDAVREHAGLDPLSADRAGVLGRLAREGVVPDGLDTLTDGLQYLFATLVEPRLPPDDLVFVHHYPSAQAVLAKLDPADSRLALRFELFCGGMELANGWEELADADQNASRAELENAERVRLGKEPIPLHPDYVDGLRSGLPPCSGVALGLDRLVMLAVGASSIEDVLVFGWNCA